MERYPQAYLDYLHHFQCERDYFECHEVLEAYWKEHPDSPLRAAWVGLIQVAVALYHHRRGNRAGAAKMMANASQHLAPEQLRELGIDAEAFLALVGERAERLMHEPEAPYADLDIPFADSSLEAACVRRCGGARWSRASDTADEALLHKHTRRDRSGVIREREASLREKARRRGGRP